MAVGLATANLAYGGAVITTSNGNIYTFFTNVDSLLIYKSTNNGASFSNLNDVLSTTIHGAASQIRKISAAIDGNGYIHVVCAAYPNASATRDISYAVLNTSDDTWGSWEQVASYTKNVGSTLGVNIALDSSSKPHIIYVDIVSNMGSDYSRIYYTNKTGASWLTPELVSTSTTTNYTTPRITFRGSDIVEAFYTSAYGVYRSRVSGTWESEGAWTSNYGNAAFGGIIVDAAGDVYRYLVNAPTQQVAENDTRLTSFNSSTVEFASSVSYISGKRFLFYSDYLTAYLKYAYNSGSGWSSIVTLESSSATQVVAEYAKNYEYQSNRINYIFGSGTDVYYGYLSLSHSVNPTADTATATDTPTVSLPDISGPRTVDKTETATATDTPTVWTNRLYCSTLDTVGTQDIPTIVANLAINKVESVSVTDASNPSYTLPVSVSDSINVTDSTDGYPDSLFIPVDETVTVSESPFISPVPITSVKFLRYATFTATTDAGSTVVVPPMDTTFCLVLVNVWKNATDYGCAINYCEKSFTEVEPRGSSADWPEFIARYSSISPSTIEPPFTFSWNFNGTMDPVYGATFIVLFFKSVNLTNPYAGGMGATSASDGTLTTAAFNSGLNNLIVAFAASLSKPVVMRDANQIGIVPQGFYNGIYYDVVIKLGEASPTTVWATSQNLCLYGLAIAFESNLRPAVNAEHEHLLDIPNIAITLVIDKTDIATVTDTPAEEIATGIVVSDSSSVSDSIVTSVEIGVSETENIVASDIPQPAFMASPAVTDIAVTSDNAQAKVSDPNVPVTDNVTASDNAQVAYSNDITVSDTAAASDVVAYLVPFLAVSCVSTADTITDSAIASISVGSSITESASASDVPVVLLANFSISKSDTAIASDSVFSNLTIEIRLVDNSSVTDTPTADILVGLSITDSATVLDNSSPIKENAINVNDANNVTDIPSAVPQQGSSIVSLASVSDEVTIALSDLQVNVLDSSSVSDAPEWYVMPPPLIIFLDPANAACQKYGVEVITP